MYDRKQEMPYTSDPWAPQPPPTRIVREGVDPVLPYAVLQEHQALILLHLSALVCLIFAALWWFSTFMYHLPEQTPEPPQCPQLDQFDHKRPYVLVQHGATLYACPAPEARP